MKKSKEYTNMRIRKKTNNTLIKMKEDFLKEKGYVISVSGIVQRLINSYNDSNR